MFRVISRYRGGAFVVFSEALNPDMTVLAPEGSVDAILSAAELRPRIIEAIERGLAKQ